MTVDEYEKALKRVYALMCANPPPGSPEEQELDDLADLVEAYESIHFPIPQPSPEAATEFRVDQMQFKDLVTEALTLCKDGKPVDAGNLLNSTVDRLLQEQRWREVQQLMVLIDPHLFPDSVLVGILTVLSHALNGDAFLDFRNRVRDALLVRWATDETKVKKLLQRLFPKVHHE